MCGPPFGRQDLPPRFMTQHSHLLAVLLVSQTPTSSLEISSLPKTGAAISRAKILCISASTISHCFRKTKAHPDRILYAATGLLFAPHSPLPFGGSKSAPGYISFRGTTPADLLTYVLASAYSSYWAFRGTDALAAVVKAMNRALDLHYQGRKYELDELMLRGMKTSGHIKWHCAAYIPFGLEHFVETDNTFYPSVVEFTPNRDKLMIQ
jgi:hypothetical protein